MKIWFLSTELVGLEGMPSSTSGVAQKARRNNWLSRKSSGSNKILEYHFSNFHTDTQNQLIEKYVTNPFEAKLLKEMAIGNSSLLPLTKEQAGVSGEVFNEKLHERMIEFVNNQPAEVREQFLTGFERDIIDEFDTHSSNITEMPNVKSVKTVSEMNDMCAVPVCNVYAACGFGAENGAEYQVRTEFLPCEWLQRFGLNEETARIITCHGDSMEDTLSNGDEVLVDIRELEHPVNHGVYVVRIGKHVYIKRLKYDIMAEGYEVISDNKEEYSPFIVNGEKLEEFAVIGKVVTTVMKTVI
ncbi:helix-turn-helix transcriptional regulator [Vibrio atlanticus]|uniref:S24 family peptidase n=1 Tax=Vibrio atlanticus TaxID=693153 RepID=UPI00354B9FD3